MKNGKIEKVVRISEVPLRESKLGANVSKLTKLGKTIIKGVPVVSLVMSCYFMTKYLINGQWTQAGIELLSMCCSGSPIGWVAGLTNLGIDAYNLYLKDDEENEKVFAKKEQEIKIPLNAYANPKVWDLFN